MDEQIKNAKKFQDEQLAVSKKALKVQIIGIVIHSIATVFSAIMFFLIYLLIKHL